MTDGHPGGFDLDAFLPYLLNQAAEATSRGFAQVYRAEYGMTRTQWRVLANLGRSGAMTASDICRVSHVEKTKVSRAVAALEERGFLARERHGADRRAETLSLRPEGRAAFERLGMLALDYDRALRARLGPEAATLARVLREMIAAGAEPGG
ncbi:Transcriptional regulator, MarR family [Rubellimicrobium mesophilum DSM 19309]|uniref:Transcriptional regulator, MarR family n=1 Tax=Rubellimicrobium mesophilum DSM 19309 TaxID=442562 RepID=A0A017HKN4_9RHOB|nr:MarR family transcriptional regulator [Rubellimicrobium mesophilum]EYD74890.1 Transcriptional regulator, MarR family [Rubellimicrobium mesophilum DSM 19309]